MKPPIGRKLHRHEENPFDNVIIDIAEWINTNIFRPLDYTPNMITTLSLLLGFASAVLFHYECYITSTIFFFTAYVLDCADGNYARTYNMETKFGDYYDHISDISKGVALMIVILLHPLSSTVKIIYIASMLIVAGMSMVHMGCQETIYNPDGFHKYDSLSCLKALCGSSTHQGRQLIRYSRYVGVGTFMLFTCTIILYTMTLKKTK